MKIKLFSFFSGAGFLDLGFETEDDLVVFVNEYNKEFLKAYKFAHNKLKLKKPEYGYYCGDINDFLRGECRQKLRNMVKHAKKIV